MAKTLTSVPRFSHTQRVRFVGGECIVRNLKPESGSWIYVIEMSLGLEPDCGRVGAETMVVLNEADLRAS